MTLADSNENEKKFGQFKKCSYFCTAFREREAVLFSQKEHTERWVSG